MNAEELFHACARTYLQRTVHDQATLAKTPDTYLRDLYGPEITYERVVAPIYNFLHYAPDRIPSKARRAAQKRFQHQEATLELAQNRHVDFYEFVNISSYFNKEFFNAQKERSNFPDSLTWREVEVMSRTSPTFASIYGVKNSGLDRSRVRLSTNLFEIYLAVLDHVRGGTTLAGVDREIAAEHATWLQDVFELFGRCYG